MSEEQKGKDFLNKAENAILFPNEGKEVVTCSECGEVIPNALTAEQKAKVIRLCEAVIKNMSTHYNDEYRVQYCPFCDKEISIHKIDTVKKGSDIMACINHLENCEYLLAKQLKEELQG